MPPVKAYQIPDWANPQNASVLDNWWTRTARTIGQFMGVNDPESQVMGLAAAPIDVPAADAAGAVKQTLKAYHGSPHDFERFDSSKIGTGEGAQAYGHGLYFAESQGVAKSYKALADPKVVIGGQEIPSPSWSPNLPPEPRVIRRLADYRAKYPDLSTSEIVEKVRQDIDRDSMSAFSADHPDSSAVAHLAQQRSVLDAATQRGIELPSVGKMYEVNIHASPDELLDWDKPLSQQPQKVQEALKSSAETAVGATRNYNNWGDVPLGDAYKYASSRPPFQQGVSDKLKDLGFKGIQYLDQGSRAAGQGTRNFVIFDDKIIDIARKYGLSLPAAAEVYRAQQRTKPQPAQTGVE